MTVISAVCVAIARPYAPRIGGRARHDASVSGTADLQFRTIAVLPGPSLHDGKSTANAVGPCGPPGFKSPILRSSQALTLSHRRQGLADPLASQPRYLSRRSPCQRFHIGWGGTRSSPCSSLIARKSLKGTARRSRPS
jgi:hypothetical protein